MQAQVLIGSFLAYIVFLVWLGHRVSRGRRADGADFLLAGRSLPTLLVLGTTLATMVGTGSSIGAVGFGYAHGWAGALYGIGGACGILLAAWWFAPARAQGFMTLSEELSWYVGGSTVVRHAVAVIIYLACIGWLGAHILGGGMYLAWISGIDPAAAKLLVALGFGIYTLVGGYRAVVWTDSLQAVVLFAGFLLMAWVSVQAAGGWGEVAVAARATPLPVLPALSLAVAIAVGVLATPSFRQRIYSARSVGAVRRSFVLTGLLYLGFSFVPAVIGISAAVLDPGLANRNFAFPFLAMDVLPLAIGAVVLLAGLSATLSSASSDAIAGVAVLVRDLYALAFGRVPEPRHVVRISRIAMAVSVAAALGLALVSDDVVTYIAGMISTVMSGLFACGVLGRFWPRFRWTGALAALLAGAAVSLWVMAGPARMALLGNPILPAVAAALMAGVFGSLLGPAQRPSRAEAGAHLAAERARFEGGGAS